MSRWIVTSAWPYSYSMPHLGNFVGSLLSADIFARYMRLKGENVVFVTGSDEHGTAIEVEALKRKITPFELTSEIHQKIVNTLKRFDISTDNYTRTHNPVHINFVREFFSKIDQNGYIFKKNDEQFFCNNDQLFLPDRLIIGSCPKCKYESARGDQCEECSILLDPTQLIQPKCSICNNSPEIRNTDQWYFDLPKFTEKLKVFVDESETLSDNAKNFTVNLLKSGLKPRSITRDNKWGIQSPFSGSNEKTIYVWMEAVLGYVSAVIEHFQQSESWREYWLKSDTNVAFFIGKDNIPFHTIVFPALLMANGDNYSLNFHIGATEYLQFDGQKFSKSKKVGIWLDEALELLPSDYWRFSLIQIRPEVKDTNFTWENLDISINEDLNNSLGNLLQRTVNIVNRYYDGKIPKIQALTSFQTSLMEDTLKTKSNVEKMMKEFRFQRALQDIMNLSRKCNALLNIEEPWKKVKNDVDEAGHTISTVMFTLKAIAIMLLPFIPNSAKKILEQMGVDPEQVNWNDIESFDLQSKSVSKKVTSVFSKIDILEIKEALEINRVKSNME